MRNGETQVLLEVQHSQWRWTSSFIQPTSCCHTSSNRRSRTAWRRHRYGEMGGKQRGLRPDSEQSCSHSSSLVNTDTINKLRADEYKNRFMEWDHFCAAWVTQVTHKSLLSKARYSSIKPSTSITVGFSWLELLEVPGRPSSSAEDGSISSALLPCTFNLLPNTGGTHS